MKKSAAFDVVIVPSSVVKKRAVELSRSLKKHGGLFVLNERLYSTHVSLYMMELPLKNLSEVRKVLKDIASNQKVFKLNPLLWHQSLNGYIDVEYKKTTPLANLQRKIIGELNPLREGLLRQKDITRLKTAKGLEKQNIQKYGFRSVGRKFEPHLTLTKLKAYKPEATPRISSKRMSFSATEIGIFYLGEHGTCKKLVAKYKLATTPKDLRP